MNAFAGTGALLRLAARRDRIQLPVWVLALTAVMAASVASISDLYGTDESRIRYAATSSTSAVALAFNGPTSGPSLGAIVVVETFGLTGVLLALMTTFLVARHTRQNEETGRAELLGAGVVGRYAALTAALALAVLANLAFGLLVYAVLAGAGLPAGGALLAGAALAATGVTFGGVAAVTAQVAESSRAANGLAGAVVGASFLARAAGDAAGRRSDDGLAVLSAWPSWVSPLGWSQQSRPFRDDHWAVLALPVGLLLILGAVAFVLSTHRDLGTGMLPVRSGPAVAPRGLLSPLGLAWRLQRGALLGWAAAVIVLGLAFGGVAEQVEDLIGGNEQMAELIARIGGSSDLVAAYFSATLGFCGIAGSGFAIQALLRLRAEETAGTLEPVLATAVGRTRWLAGHVAVAVLGTALLLALAGAAAGLAYGLATGDLPGRLAALVGGALVRLPAALVLAGLTVAVFGLAPRFTVAAAWGALAACVLVLQVGALLNLPQVVLDLSPFTHVPAAPAAGVRAAPLLALTAVALALAGTGLLLFRRRDLTP